MKTIIFKGVMTEFSFECLSDESAWIVRRHLHPWTGRGSPRDLDRKVPAIECWPDWLQTDLTQANVYLLGYPTDIISTWLAGEMSLYERAKAVLDHLAARGLGGETDGNRLMDLVGCSGSNLSERVMMLQTRWKAISTSCKLIMFLGTPHSGSSVASAIGFVAPKLSSK